MKMQTRSRTRGLQIALLTFASILPQQGRAQEDATPSQTLPEDYSCVLCHRKGGDLWTDSTPIADEEHLAQDIHWGLGLRCHDCHGGSPDLGSFKNHRDDENVSQRKVTGGVHRPV